MDSKNTFVKMIEVFEKIYKDQSGKNPEVILYTAAGMVKGTLDLTMMNTLHDASFQMVDLSDIKEPCNDGDLIVLKDVTIGFPAIGAAKINEMYFYKDAILGFTIFDGTVEYKRVDYKHLVSNK